jgi:dGTPase
MPLATYAVRAEDSAGRRFPEPGHAYREPFQRDRDRIIHSRAFRRLENKTQVFTRRYSDHFRNRLTHTIEVAQISRTVAAALHLNPDLMETLALCHDIGHPPFGHAGEKALDECMAGHGGFDHNLHALRTVEHFEERYIDFRGLNLMFEVREGIIKHSHDYAAGSHPELAEYLLDQRPPLEAQLIDLTDEIAYCTADLDDGVEAEILTFEQIRAGVPLFARLFADVEREHPAAEPQLKFNETVKRMLDRLVGDLISNTQARIKTANIESLADVRKHPSRLAAFSAEVEAERKQVKKFLYANLYYSAPLRQDKDRSEQVIRAVFDYLLKHPEAMPRSFQAAAKQEPLARVVCDYVAGMTDTFITRVYEKYCGGRARA